MTQATEKTIRRNPLIYLFGKTWEYSAGNRKNVVLYWILFIIANAVTLIAHPLIMAKIFYILQAEGVTSANWWTLMALLGANFSLTFIFWGLHGPARCIELENAYRATGNYCKHIIKGILGLSLDWHAEHHSGDTIDKIEKGRQGISAFASESFQIIFSAVRLVVSIGMLTYFSHSAGIITLVMIAITIVIVMFFDRKIMINYRILNENDNLVSAQIIDAISHVTTIISLRVEKPIFALIAENITVRLPLYKANNRLIEMKWCLVNVCCSLLWVLVLITYFWKQKDVAGGVLIGSIFLLVRYLDEMSDLFYRFTDMYSQVLRQQSRVLNAEKIAKDFRPENTISQVLPEQWQTIQIENLHFSYQNTQGDTRHLRDISLSLRRGERIALVGWSGSGKSTFLKVLRNLHQPEKVGLSIDGVRIEQGLAGIENNIALIPQLPEIFATTIRSNLTIGIDYPSETMQRCMDMAHFSEVAEALPKKLESTINERGVNLSGGQRQRLALARGLLAAQGKSIILIDEPTSSVDEATKHEIYRDIFEEFPDACIVFATHELHLLSLFDHIYMFEEGRIVGSGTLEHLQAHCPEFRDLCKHPQQERSS